MFILCLVNIERGNRHWQLIWQRRALTLAGWVADPPVHAHERGGALATYRLRDVSGALLVVVTTEEEQGRAAGYNNGYTDCVHSVHAAVVMAGTATEQLVGLGLPVCTVPGDGPQFTPHFARLQKRLLGDSVVLCHDASDVGARLLPLLQVGAEHPQ